jgi:DNA-binding MarR family transcriptional regulator
MTDAFHLEDFLPFRLNLVAQTVSERLSLIYAERFGLDIPQWRVLANLASHGEMTAQAIAKLTQGHKSTISRAIKPLEDRELIIRWVSDADKRAFTLRLSAKGQGLFAELLPLVLDFEAELLSRLEPDELNALFTGLGALERALKTKDAS